MSDFDPPQTIVTEVVARALSEDLAPLGDMTAALVPSDAVTRAFVVAREAGVLAGRSCGQEAFRQVDPTLRVEWQCDDGDALGAGDTVAEVSGALRSILTAERTALNLLCHLSGIATLTRRYVDAAAAASEGRTRILDTRKTTPGLRALEKAAVRAGGGFNHRGSLSDGVLLKDNHLGEVDIADAVSEARRRWPGRMVEVECDRTEQVWEAVGAGATMVLLDNMEPDEVAACVKEIDGRCLVEVSGGVSLENVGHFARAGADFISVGRLTHSAPILDLALDLAAKDEGDR